MKENGLIPVTKRTKDEAREISKRGGIASGRSRRLKRSMRETAMTLLEEGIKPDKLPKNLKEIALLASKDKCKKVDWQVMMMMGQLANAASGNPRSAKFIIDLLGEATAQDEELSKVDKMLIQLDEVMNC
ncbi:hypothetical protein FWH30_01210 [Microgenomates group bacterium]|nr:hypothetical protein [Microgenomates group bacterium]